jgi:hypothetical protein
MTLGALVLTAALLFAACQSPTDGEDEEYTALPASASNGRIIAVPEKAAPGTEITLVLIPDVYYTLAAPPAVTVTADGSAVPLTEKETAEPYTFTMPAADVTVSASFVVNPSHNIVPIYSAADLAKIGVDEAYPMNGVYQLEADFAVADWTPIGEFPAKPFTGILRGNKHTITLNSFSEAGLAKQAVGLFGYTAFAEMEDLTVNAELGDITLEDTAEDSATLASFGLVIGNSLSANLKNITVSGEINNVESTTATTFAVGGIIGLISSGKIETSHVLIAMTGNSSGLIYIGGIAGYVYAYTNAAPFSTGVIISDCSVDGELEGGAQGDSFTGGMAGFCGIDTTIEGCQVKGNILSNSKGGLTIAGGIAGRGVVGTISIDTCSVAEGLVTANSSSSATSAYAGGIIGSAASPISHITRCISAADVTASFDGTSSSSSLGVYAGGIFGYNVSSSPVQYCSASGSVLAQNIGTLTGSGGKKVVAGGIGGQSSNNNSIEQCYATGNVEALFSANDTSTNNDITAAGGILGMLGETASGSVALAISDCYYDGSTISAKSRYAHGGGIVGLVGGYTNHKVYRSYSRGAILAEGSARMSETNKYQGARIYYRNTAGGIAGSLARWNGSPTVENCVALTGALTVTGPEDFYIKSGRVVGNNEGQGANSSGYTEPAIFGLLQNNAANSAMTITKIVTDGATTGPETVTDAAETPENTVNGKGVSTPGQAEYVALGWDFTDVWKMGAAGYPVLAWQD